MTKKHRNRHDNVKLGELKRMLEKFGLKFANTTAVKDFFTRATGIEAHCIGKNSPWLFYWGHIDDFINKHKNDLSELVGIEKVADMWGVDGHTITDNPERYPKPILPREITNKPYSGQRARWFLKVAKRFQEELVEKALIDMRENEDSTHEPSFELEPTTDEAPEDLIEESPTIEARVDELERQIVEITKWRQQVKQEKSISKTELVSLISFEYSTNIALSDHEIEYFHMHSAIVIELNDECFCCARADHFLIEFGWSEMTGDIAEHPLLLVTANHKGNRTSACFEIRNCELIEFFKNIKPFEG